MQMAQGRACSRLVEGPVVGTQLVCSRNSTEARVAGAEGTDRGRGASQRGVNTPMDCGKGLGIVLSVTRSLQGGKV